MTATAAATPLERVAQISDELGDYALASEARAEDERLREARFFVACLGQFKRGKSTLVNALVEHPVLPVGVVPVTSIVTVLRYANAPAATVRFVDGRTEQVAVDAVATFIDERQNPGNHRQATLVDLSLPSPILQDGLCLVDTPGLGSVHAANTEATRDFVPRTDVALFVVGPDPPISGAELQLIEEISGEAGELLVVVNKADQASPGQLQEVVAFTRTTIEAALMRPIGPIFEVSARECLDQQRPTRDWLALETHLRTLAADTRQHLVETAGLRSVRRLSRRLAADLAQRDDALRKPVAEIEARVVRLRSVLADLDRSLIELRFLFDAIEADLGRQFEAHRVRFIAEAVPRLRVRLQEWIAADAAIDHSLRAQAFEEAHRLAVDAIDEWLRGIEPEAHALYRAAAERLLRLANEYLSRVTTDAGDLDTHDLPSQEGFRIKPQFYFASLMSATGGNPLSWAIDRFAPGNVRQPHVARAATAYLVHLLESNSYRVENDLKDRTRESRRWLEGRIRTRLTGALHSAERAVAVATEKQHWSESQVDERLTRLKVLRAELAAVTQ